MRAREIPQLARRRTDVVAYREEAYLTNMASDGVVIGGIRYVRAPKPIHFPESAEVPESRLHEDLCALLRALLRYAFEKEHSVGGDQFIYWDAAHPRQCIAADAFVRLGQPESAALPSSPWRSSATRTRKAWSRRSKNTPVWASRS